MKKKTQLSLWKNAYGGFVYQDCTNIQTLAYISEKIIPHYVSFIKIMNLKVICLDFEIIEGLAEKSPRFAAASSNINCNCNIQFHGKIICKKIFSKYIF